jgi:membrane-associated phospholipid phosphatase
MNDSRRTTRIAVLLAVATTVGGSAFAQLPSVAAIPENSVQTVAPPTATSASSLGSPWTHLFTDTIRDFRRLPSRNSAEWLALGAVAAFGAHQADSGITRDLSRSGQLHETVEAGAFLGSTPFQLAGAAATFAIGRATDSPGIAAVGADLIRAQFLAEAMTIGVKQSIRRNRPEGTGFGFPSGHTTVTFASATVLQRHFGWKAGLPAYAVAGYVGISRVQMRRHYLSDVAFGAALGIVAGRTVTIGRGRGLELAPMATPGGAGVSFKWLGRTSP